MSDFFNGLSEFEKLVLTLKSCFGGLHKGATERLEIKLVWGCICKNDLCEWKELSTHIDTFHLILLSLTHWLNNPKNDQMKDPLNNPLNNPLNYPLNNHWTTTKEPTEQPSERPTELNLVVKNVFCVNLRAAKTDQSILTGNTKVRGRRWTWPEGGKAK